MTVLVVILSSLFIGGVILWVALPKLARRDAAETSRWARSEGVDLDDTTRPVVEAYLGTSRNLRHIGAVGGLLVAPAVTAGTGIDLELPWVVWLLAGYLIGCLWAELALTRRPGSGRRAASLTPRRLADYLPPAMLRLEVLAPLAVLALGLACGWAVEATTYPLTSSWSVASAPEVLRRGAVLAGFLAVAATVGIVAAQRHIVRRPQPLTDPPHVAVDDAMRSSSVRLLGATGIAAVGVLASVQLSYLAASTHGTWSGLLGAASVATFLSSLLQWRWWPHRGWRVRRLPARPATSSSLVATADRPLGGHHG
jgi:hypothetical protein